MVQKEDLGTTTALTPGNQPTGDQRTEPAAHTPGPWSVYDMNPTTVLANRYSLKAFAVADCSPTVRGSTEDEAEANARLIAAAPDMFAALNVALNEIHHPGACAYEKGRDITEFLEEAIAKAEGR